MHLTRVLEIYEIIKKRLPDTYPQSKIGFYEDEDSLSKNMKIKLGKQENLYGACDPGTNTVLLPLSMEFEYKRSDGSIYTKKVPIHKMSEDDISATILHEIAHLFFAQKYGWGSEQYYDEDACEQFAKRWLAKLKKEKLL